MYEGLTVKAENFYCFPALLEAICRCRYCVNIDQRTIGNKLGITVPDNYNLEGNSVTVKRSGVMNDWGVHVEELPLIAFFHSIGVEVEVNLQNINTIYEGTLALEINKMLQGGSDVICGFSYGELYGIDSLRQCGHVGLVVSVSAHGVVKFYDPGPRDVGMKEYDDLHLYDAMHVRDGFLLSIRPKPNNKELCGLSLATS